MCCRKCFFEKIIGGLFSVLTNMQGKYCVNCGAFNAGSFCWRFFSPGSNLSLAMHSFLPCLKKDSDKSFQTKPKSPIKIDNLAEIDKYY